MRRGRYGHYWYGVVLAMLKKYPGIKEDRTMQSSVFCNAVENAIEDTKQLEHGEERIRAMEMLYFKGTHSIDGVALELHYSRKTVQNWCRSFVNLVATYAGYKK